MPSFDVISEVNQVEVRNAVEQANKEISTRFDFKGSDARVEPKEKELTLYADDDFKLKQVTDVLVGKLTKRGIDIRALKFGNVERIFEDAGIQGELDAYNPLIPDGSNWKATMLIEYDDVEQRRRALAQLVGIEDRLWVQVSGFPRVYAIADEDLERETEDKTSSVHFVRFEFSPEMVSALKGGSAVTVGVDHPQYTFTSPPLPEETRKSLIADLA